MPLTKNLIPADEQLAPEKKKRLRVKTKKTPHGIERHRALKEKIAGYSRQPFMEVLAVFLDALNPIPNS